MTSDKDYLGKGNIDKFDALFFKIRHFGKNDQGQNFYLELLELIRIICFLLQQRRQYQRKGVPIRDTFYQLMNQLVFGNL